MTAEANRTVDPFEAGTAIQDWVPVRSDGVQGAEASPAIAPMHRGAAPAQALSHLRQPSAVGRLVVVIGIDGIVHLFTGNAAGVDHFAVRRFEVESLNEVTVDGTVATAIARPAEKGDL